MLRAGLVVQWRMVLYGAAWRRSTIICSFTQVGSSSWDPILSVTHKCEGHANWSAKYPEGEPEDLQLFSKEFKALKKALPL